MDLSCRFCHGVKLVTSDLEFLTLNMEVISVKRNTQFYKSYLYVFYHPVLVYVLIHKT